MNPLFSDFAAASFADWQAAAVRSLKGASLDDLASSTPEGITIQPLYPPTDSAYPRPALAAGWHIVEDEADFLRPFTRITPDSDLTAVAPTPPLLIDLAPAHETGTHAAQELAQFAATLTALLNQQATVTDLHVRFAIGSHLFMELAKLRAARHIYAQILAAFELADTAVHIHATTSQRSKSSEEPYTNLLRTTTEALTAVLGGADSLYVAPHDATFAQPTDFSRRIARNVQLILKEEVNLDHFIDPAGGAWYVEALTQDLGERAWMLFQDIERR